VGTAPPRVLDHAVGLHGRDVSAGGSRRSASRGAALWCSPRRSGAMRLAGPRLDGTRVAREAEPDTRPTLREWRDHQGAVRADEAGSRRSRSWTRFGSRLTLIRQTSPELWGHDPEFPRAGLRIPVMSPEPAEALPRGSTDALFRHVGIPYPRRRGVFPGLGLRRIRASGGLDKQASHASSTDRKAPAPKLGLSGGLGDPRPRMEADPSVRLHGGWPLWMIVHRSLHGHE